MLRGLRARIAGRFNRDAASAPDEQVQAVFLTTEQFFDLYPEFQPEQPTPRGVLVRQWDPPMDVYWPSWAAWRFAQGSPEYVWIKDVATYAAKISHDEGNVAHNPIVRFG